MGYFKDEQLKKIDLTVKGYWVKILTDLRYGDLKKVSSVNADGDVDFIASADIFLQTVVKEWNLDDENGTVLEITPENIDRLSKDDVELIITEAGGLIEGEDAKKKFAIAVNSVLSGNDLADPPIEIVEYLICKEFGWTINELMEQPAQKVQRFLLIMQLQKQNERIRAERQ